MEAKECGRREKKWHNFFFSFSSIKIHSESANGLKATCMHVGGSAGESRAPRQLAD